MEKTHEFICRTFSKYSCMLPNVRFPFVKAPEKGSLLFPDPVASEASLPNLSPNGDRFQVSLQPSWLLCIARPK